MTESLSNSYQSLAEQLDVNAATSRQLDSSSQTIGATLAQHQVYNEEAKVAKSLITRLVKRETIDKIMLGGAVLFFCCVVLYILKQRIGSTLFWWW